MTHVTFHELPIGATFYFVADILPDAWRKVSRTQAELVPAGDSHPAIEWRIVVHAEVVSVNAQELIWKGEEHAQ